MKKMFATAAVACLLAGPALASSCPALMDEIDVALASETHADPDVLEQIQALRAEGEELHNAGKHGESVEKLEQALELLEGHEAEDH